MVFVVAFFDLALEREVQLCLLLIAGDTWASTEHF